MSKKRTSSISKLSVFQKGTVVKRQIIPRKTIKILRRFLKKQVKKKKKSLSFSILMNYDVFYKGKNPRMGRGKGSFTRLAYQIEVNQRMLHLSGFSVQRYKALSTKLATYNVYLL